MKPRKIDTWRERARRASRNAFKLEPKPRSLAAMLVSVALVVAALSCATYVATPSRGIAYFLIYAALGAGLIGVALPVSYTALAKGLPPSALGLTVKRLPESLAIQALCLAPLAPKLLGQLRGMEILALAPLIALSLAIGFFEAIFWRGWVFQTLEESFGLVPALVAGAALYAGYHVGYGMPLGEMVFLFFVGLMFNAVFALTRNAFALWPLFQPAGQLITVIGDGLRLPAIATVGFLEALAAMIAVAMVFARQARKRAKIRTDRETASQSPLER